MMPGMTPQDLFRLHSIFGALTNAETPELMKRAVTKRVAAGEVVFRKDDPGNGLYGVLTGSILIVVESPEGKELILNRHGPGEFFGEVALLDGEGRSATAVAREASQLFFLGRAEFLAFLRQRPDAMIRIIAFLCARLRRATNLVEDSDLPERSQPAGQAADRLARGRRTARRHQGRRDPAYLPGRTGPHAGRLA